MSNRAPAHFQPPARRAGLYQRIVRFLRAFGLALQVRRERRMLLGMDDRTLKDLGLSGIAHAEASRPFWDVPLDRLRADAVCRYGKGQIPLGIPGFRSP
jgi:uncharacterized protein YjiS (DUF1127 family)